MIIGVIIVRGNKLAVKISCVALLVEGIIVVTSSYSWCTTLWSMVQAYAAHEAGGKLEPFEYELGPLKPDEVEIDVDH